MLATLLLEWVATTTPRLSFCNSFNLSLWEDETQAAFYVMEAVIVTSIAGANIPCLLVKVVYLAALLILIGHHSN